MLISTLLRWCPPTPITNFTARDGFQDCGISSLLVTLHLYEFRRQLWESTSAQEEEPWVKQRTKKTSTKPALLLQTSRTFNAQRGFGLSDPSLALVHTSILGLYLHDLELWWVLIPLDFVLLWGLNEHLVLEPLHMLWGRPEVTGQDDWVSLQDGLVLQLPGDLDVVICTAGVGKKNASI